MKKFFLLIAATLAFLNHAVAQERSETKVYLPEKGDMAIGINLNPILNFVGNVFNGSTNNQLDYIGGQTATATLNSLPQGVTPTVSIMGKYMIKDNFGLKFNVGFLFANDQDNKYVRNDKAFMIDPFNESQLIDTRSYKRNGMSLMVGTEFRKGSRRVQGVFGAGILFGFSNDQFNYSYGNEITSINQHPSNAWDETHNGYRVLTSKANNNVFIGVTGSVGVEWFVAPKLSLGAEMNLNLYYVDGGQQFIESEGYNVAYERVETRCDLTSPGNNKFRFGMENLGGSLYMAFYF